MKKYKHKPYRFELHVISLLREMDMVPNYLYEGWRTIPQHLREKQQYYYANPTLRGFRLLMQQDTRMYYGILDMLKKRVDRVSNLKCTNVIRDNIRILKWQVKEPVKTKQGLTIHNYVGNQETMKILRKYAMIVQFQTEFVRTGQVINITHLRKVDKELVADIKEFINR